jgi:hypothetical protein
MKQPSRLDRDEEIKINFWGLKVEAKNPKKSSFTILLIVLFFIMLFFYLKNFT